MLRQQKRNLDIPPPTRRTVILPLNASERHSYNATVALAMVNMVTTGLDYRMRDGAHPDSLLNPKNSAHLRSTLRNIRVAACGGGHAVLTLSPAKFQETLTLLEQWGQPREVQERVRAYMVRVLQNDLHIRAVNGANANGSANGADAGAGAASGEGLVMCCEYCDLPLDILLIAPCGCQICPLCMDNSGDVCPVCANAFVWDNLQLLQPGFEAKEFVFDNNSGGDGGDGGVGVGGLPEVPTASNNHSQSSKAAYLVEQVLRVSAEYEAQLHSRSGNGSSMSDNNSSDIYTASKSRVRFGDEDALQSPVCTSTSTPAGANTPAPVCPKVIVFSQFPEFLDCIAISLRQAGVKFVDLINKHSAGQVLAQFEHNHTVRVLLLGKLGSVGLDLSFVTHVYLMEPVLDYTLEDQLVSRAYRLGCRQGVQVTLLVMHHTLEELIYNSVKCTKEIDHLMDMYKSVEENVLNTTNYSSRKLALTANLPPGAATTRPTTAGKDMTLTHYLITNLSLVLTS